MDLLAKTKPGSEITVHLLVHLPAVWDKRTQAKSLAGVRPMNRRRIPKFHGQSMSDIPPPPPPPQGAEIGSTIMFVADTVRKPNDCWWPPAVDFDR